MAVESLPSLEALGRFAGNFVAQNPNAGAFGLYGNLGAGKTSFVRSVIEVLCKTHGVGVPRVISPSYVIHQNYALSAQIQIDHFDLYRLPSLSDEGLAELGFFESLERADKGGWLFIEWPERLPAKYLPSRNLTFSFSGDSRSVAYA